MGRWSRCGGGSPSWIDEAVTPAAWAIDDTGLLKCGNASPCVARQYTGTAGKVTNCQVAVSASAWSPTPRHVRSTGGCSCPSPGTRPRRRPRPDVLTAAPKAGIGRTTSAHREKWRLALDMIDELIGWGPPPAADRGRLRIRRRRGVPPGLAERGLSYVVQVSGRRHRLPQLDGATRTTAPIQRRRPYPEPRYREPAPCLPELVTAAGAGAARTGDLARRVPPPRRATGADVVAVRVRRVRPAGRAMLPRTAAGPARGMADRGMAGRRPPNRSSTGCPTCPPRTPKRPWSGWAKLRWRIEHDYREVKTGLGLDHYEGRTWQGWHHHVTLVSAAHAFLHPATPGPKNPLRRNDPLRRTPTPANPARPPHRHLPNLQNPLPTTETTTRTKIMTKHY